MEALVRLIKSCSDTTEVRRADEHILKSGRGKDHYLGNLLIHKYGKLPGGLEDAVTVFRRITGRNVFSWGVLLTAYVHNGLVHHAMDTFQRMPNRSQLTWSCMVAAHAACGHLHIALELFTLMPARDHVSWTGILQAYSQNGHLLLASNMFERMPMHDLVSANLMITANAQNGHLEKAKSVFQQLPQRSVVSWTAMLTAYAKNGDLNEARQTFHRIPPGLRNVVTWNSLISTYADYGCYTQAVNLFHLMPEWTSASCNTVLVAYSNSGLIQQARHVFESGIPIRSEISWNALIQAYVDSSDVHSASSVLDRMPAWDVVSCTSVMAGLPPVKLEQFFHEAPVRNEVAWTLLLQGFAEESDWRRAEQVFYKMPQWNVICSTCMVTLYGHCGRIEQAKEVFKLTESRDVVSWSAVVAACAYNGLDREAIYTYQLMLLDGFSPDTVCYGGLFLACSHLGLVKESCGYLNEMVSDHELVPTRDHFCCMIDILGRAGLVKEAEELLHGMPYEPNSVAHVSLLAAARQYNDVESASRVVSNLFTSTARVTSSSPYILLANMYAANGRHQECAAVKSAMQRSGTARHACTSSIEIDGEVHTFRVGECKSEKLREEVTRLSVLMNEEFPDTSQCVHDVKDDVKLELLSLHSEKLAVAHGLLNTKPGTALTVLKNLKVCSHCHTFMKRISAVSQRRIVLRDASRFHRFENGDCSCKDYW